MNSDLELALEMADVADQLSMSRYRALDLSVETKPDFTPVTEADRAVETSLREQLANGPAPVAAINVAMRDAGFGRRQIDHAADVLNVVKEKQRDGWHWRMPAKSSPLTSSHVEPHDEFAAFAPSDDAGVLDRWR
jgi:3'-phosphoadenosine 5'-phosphosulfate (PAPS) 3'-phosphatase